MLRDVDGSVLYNTRPWKTNVFSFYRVDIVMHGISVFISPGSNSNSCVYMIHYFRDIIYPWFPTHYQINKKTKLKPTQLPLQTAMVIMDNVIRDLIVQFYKAENAYFSWLRHPWMKKGCWKDDGSWSEITMFVG